MTARGPGPSAEQPAVPLREILQKAKAQPDRARQQQVLLEELRKVDPERAQRMQDKIDARNQQPATGGTTVARGDRPGVGLWLALAGVVAAAVLAWLMLF